jgi:Ca2+-transporting ATPase
VAKSASELILTDDDFTSVVRAVAEGRGIYANIKKAIHYLLSCNIGEIVTISVATALGFGKMPLTPVQLLWLNLVTDSLPALALGMEPVEGDVMEQAPRNARAPLFSRAFSWRLAWQGFLVGGLTLFAFWLGEGYFQTGTGSSMAFATLTFCQLFHAFDVRSETQSLFQIGVFSNPAMNKAFVIGSVMQVSVLCFPPLRVLFDVAPMGQAEWLCVLGLALTPLVVCEITKAFARVRRKGAASFQKINDLMAEGRAAAGRR